MARMATRIASGLAEDRPRRRWRRRPGWRGGHDPQLPQPQPEARTDTSNTRGGLNRPSISVRKSGPPTQHANNLNAGDDQGRRPRCDLLGSQSRLPLTSTRFPLRRQWH
jgi:hypothetical protein